MKKIKNAQSTGEVLIWAMNEVLAYYKGEENECTVDVVEIDEKTGKLTLITK